MNHKVLVYALALLIMISSIAAAENRLPVASVVASTDDGNVAANVLDGRVDTRWSGSGDGAWIKFDLGSIQTIAYLGISFHQGDKRYTDIDVELSRNETDWETVYQGHENEQTTGLIKLDIIDTQARFVRIVGHGYVYFDGSKTGEWNSINEVHFYPSDDLPFDELAEGEKPIKIRYFEPGLINADGSKHKVHSPNQVTGKTINVLDYGADPAVSDSDDTKAINDALKAAEKGDEVFLPDGSYQLYSKVKLRSGVNLRGESMENTILEARPQEGQYSSNVLDIVGKNNILISNFTLTSAFAGNFSSDHTINNPDRDGPKYAVKVESSKTTLTPSYNITIDHLLIEKYQVMGVRIASSHDVVVKNSTFRKATDLGGGGAGYGVVIQGAGAGINRRGYQNDSRFNVVENCTFNGPYLRHGVLLQYWTHNNVIRHNMLTKIKLDAIDLHGEDEYLNEIYGNAIFDIETGAGIGVGNTGANHDQSGRMNFIHHNYIVNAREGIKVHLGSPGTIIEKNYITGSKVPGARGIYLQNAPGTIVRKNIFRNNHSPDFWAIYLADDPGTKNQGIGMPQAVLIERNKFFSVRNGIRLESGKDITLKNNWFWCISGLEINDTRDMVLINRKPSDIIPDLNRWKLTLPLDVNGRDSSAALSVEDRARPAAEIKDNALIDYELTPYFQVDRDGVRFRAHVAGATTPGSKYPRCELRQRVGGGDNYWSINDPQKLVTELIVTHVPLEKPELSMVQIHGPEDEPLRVQYHTKYGVYIIWNEYNKDYKNAVKYKPGERLRVEVLVDNGLITCIITNLDTQAAYEKTWQSSDQTGYFKLGAYTQSSMFLNEIKGDSYNDEPIDAYGEIIVYTIELEETY